MFNVEISQEWLIATVALLIFVSFAVAAFRIRSSTVSKKVMGLQKKSRMFSSSERRFFESLTDALDYDYHIFAKVSVLEVIDKGPRMSKGRFKHLQRELADERFDFVVCKKTDLSVTAVIELECFERRVSKARKQRRDGLISEICKAAKLRLFYFDTRQDYLGMDIRRLITGSSKCAKPVEAQSLKTSQPAAVIESPSMVTEHVGHNSCPECHSDLVTKMAVKGEFIGERFLMCRKYPYCEYRVRLNDPNVVNLRSASEQQTKEVKKGFSDWSG